MFLQVLSAVGVFLISSVGFLSDSNPSSKSVKAMSPLVVCCASLVLCYQSPFLGQTCPPSWRTHSTQPCYWWWSWSRCCSTTSCMYSGLSAGCKNVTEAHAPSGPSVDVHCVEWAVGGAVPNKNTSGLLTTNLWILRTSNQHSARFSVLFVELLKTENRDAGAEDELACMVFRY